MRDLLKSKKPLIVFGLVIFAMMSGFMITPASAVDVPSDLGVSLKGSNAVEILPAWRWSGGTSSLYTNYGVRDSGQAITSFIASFFFGISSFIWMVMLALATVSTMIFYGADMANLVNRGWGASFEAIVSSGIIGVIIFFLLAGAIFRALASSFRDLGLRQILAGLTFLSLFFYFGFTAQNSAQQYTNNQAAGGVGQNDIPGTTSPGELTLKLVEYATGTASNVSTRLVNADITGTIEANESDPDVLSCVSYEAWLTDNLWEDAVLEDQGVSAAFTKDYLKLVSNTWETSQYQMWKFAQFGMDNNYGDKVSCYFLESRNGDAGLATYYLAGHVSNAADSTGFDGQVGLSASADASDVICIVQLPGFIGGVGNQICSAVDGITPEVTIIEGEGEVLAHGTEAIFRRNMIGFAACKDVGGVIGVNEGWEPLSNGKGTSSQACQDWLATGETKDIDGGSPWDYSTKDSILEATRDSQAYEARNFILALNGHNSASVIFAFFSLLTAVIIGFYLARVTIGLIFATFISVVYGIFAPFMLLAAASGVPSVKQIGLASLRRWFSSMFAAVALIFFITAVMLTNRIVQAVINILFAGTDFTASSAGLGVSGFVQSLLLSLSTILAFFLVTGFLKRNNMKGLYTAKGMRDWANSSYSSANDQGAWSNHMRGTVGGAKGFIKGRGRLALDQYQENLIEGLKDRGVGPFAFFAKDKHQKAADKTKGRESLINKISKGDPEVGQAMKDTNSELKELERKRKKVLNTKVSPADQSKQDKEIADLNKEIADRERSMKGFETDGKRYKDIVDSSKELARERNRIQNELDSAIASGDQKLIDESILKLSQADSELKELDVAKELLEDGYRVDSKQGKKLINQRLLAEQAPQPVSALPVLEKAVQDSPAMRRAGEELAGSAPQDIFRDTQVEDAEPIAAPDDVATKVGVQPVAPRAVTGTTVTPPPPSNYTPPPPSGRVPPASSVDPVERPAVERVVEQTETVVSPPPVVETVIEEVIVEKPSEGEARPKSRRTRRPNRDRPKPEIGTQPDRPTGETPYEIDESEEL